MGVVPSKMFSGALTPVCNNCGISHCNDITQNEYEEMKNFWDNWECDVCNPNIRNHYLKGVREKKKHDSINS